ERERERRPGDCVLLYERSAFVWGSYRSRPPVLVPAPEVANGFFVAPDDPAVIVVRGDDVERSVARALAGGSRVWFVGSRLSPTDEEHILAALAAGGHIVREERRARGPPAGGEAPRSCSAQRPPPPPEQPRQRGARA